MNTNKKYDCWFCHCGRIHIMDYDEFKWLEEDYVRRKIVRICRNCGAIYVQHLDTYEDGYAICGTDIYDSFDGTKPTVIQNDEENEYKFYISGGIEVPLKSGGYANYYHGVYVNTDYIKDKYNTTYIPDAEKLDPDCVKVDIDALINKVKDPDILQCISGYCVKIDWSGTPYERKK